MIEYEHTFNPTDEDHRSQEMYREAIDAEYDAKFSEVGRCISCLDTTEISDEKLCEACDDMNTSIGGSLAALLSN